MNMFKTVIAVLLLCSAVGVSAGAEDAPDPKGDILVTFDNDDARSSSGGLGAPYSHRKRYDIARSVRRDATDIAREHSLEEIAHWPIQSLSVYCFVFRVPDGTDRLELIEALNADSRVESAQPLQSFETSFEKSAGYDDTYANLQYTLDILDIAAAHRTTRGAGIRIAIIDSHADRDHEDLLGRIQSVRVFSNKGESEDKNHGTAVASIIGARSNNARGIVGVAPEATLELYVSCWSGGEAKAAVCDSFSLSKALDAVLEDPPDVLNLSLNGPHDPLLERLIQKAYEAGVVVVAAGSSNDLPQKRFPSSMRDVLGVGATSADETASAESHATLYAPGDRILVAVPTNRYDFRSGSSLAAAHVSGVVALILAVAPDLSANAIGEILRQSQVVRMGADISINACDALNLAIAEDRCGD